MDIQWGSVADWVSGIGSLSAAIVALYIAKSQSKVKLEGYFGHRVLVGAGTAPIDLITTSVTNVGSRTTIVSNIGVRIGRFKKRHAILTFNSQSIASNPIPTSLADGQQGIWNIELDFQGKNWIEEICEGFIATKSDADSLCAVVHTTNGGMFYFRAEENLKKKIYEVLDRKAAEKLSNIKPAI